MPFDSLNGNRSSWSLLHFLKLWVSEGRTRSLIALSLLFALSNTHGQVADWSIDTKLGVQLVGKIQAEKVYDSKAIDTREVQFVSNLDALDVDQAVPLWFREIGQKVLVQNPFGCGDCPATLDFILQEQFCDCFLEVNNQYSAIPCTQIELNGYIRIQLIVSRELFDLDFSGVGLFGFAINSIMADAIVIEYNLKKNESCGPIQNH